MDKVKFFFRYRPVSILGMAGAVRDILLGLGFILGFKQITHTLIYQNYNELWPDVSGPVVGVVLILIGIAIIWAAMLTKRRYLVGAFKFQAALWFFSTIMYILNGHWMLAGIFGVFFCFPAIFMALHIKYNPPQDELIAELATREA